MSYPMLKHQRTLMSQNPIPYINHTPSTFASLCSSLLLLTFPSRSLSTPPRRISHITKHPPINLPPPSLYELVNSLPSRYVPKKKLHISKCTTDSDGLSNTRIGNKNCISILKPMYSCYLIYIHIKCWLQASLTVINEISMWHLVRNASWTREFSFPMIITPSDLTWITTLDRISNYLMEFPLGRYQPSNQRPLALSAFFSFFSSKPPSLLHYKHKHHSVNRVHQSDSRRQNSLSMIFESLNQRGLIIKSLITRWNK